MLSLCPSILPMVIAKYMCCENVVLTKFHFVKRTSTQWKNSLHSHQWNLFSLKVHQHVQIQDQWRTLHRSETYSRWTTRWGMSAASASREAARSSAGTELLQPGQTARLPADVRFFIIYLFVGVCSNISIRLFFKSYLSIIFTLKVFNFKQNVCASSGPICRQLIV